MGKIGKLEKDGNQVKSEMRKKLRNQKKQEIERKETKKSRI